MHVNHRRRRRRRRPQPNATATERRCHRLCHSISQSYHIICVSLTPSALTQCSIGVSIIIITIIIKTRKLASKRLSLNIHIYATHIYATTICPPTQRYRPRSRPNRRHNVALAAKRHRQTAEVRPATPIKTLRPHTLSNSFVAAYLSMLQRRRRQREQRQRQRRRRS